MSDKNDFGGEVTIGGLRRVAGRYEFSCPEYDLIVRGHYIEWVLEAAAEMIRRTDQMGIDGKIEELTMLAEFDDSVSSVDIDKAKYEARARFETLPQCVVCMGDNDYRWVHPQARKDAGPSYLQRLHDHSLTQEPGSWLVDEAQA